MKTFKQFIREDDEEDYVFLHEIMQQCKQFVRESKQEGFLYRGMKTSGYHQKTIYINDDDFDGEEHKFFKKKVRKDRQSLTTSNDVHLIVDDWFEDKFGFRARSQAAFAFGEPGREAAAEYGPLHVILPIGGFRYVWSPEVQDLFSYVEGARGDRDRLNKLMDGLAYRDTGLDKAVAYSNEIMIYCENYYAIPIKDAKMLKQLKRAFVEYEL